MSRAGAPGDPALERWGPWRLAGIGAALGLALAVWSSLGRPQPALGGPPPAATVDGRVIPLAEYLRAVEAIAADRGRRPTAAERARALAMLIREELLVQQALELDLVRADRTVRKAVVAGMLQAIAGEVAGAAPTADELRAFHAAHPEVGAAGVRLHVRVARADDAAAADAFAAALLAGADFDRAMGALAGVRPVEVPDTPVPIHKLRDYLGPTLAESAARAEPGTIVGPIPVDGARYVVWVKSRAGGRAADFDAVRPQVEAEWRRRREARRAEAHLARLERRARIERRVDPAAPVGQAQAPRR